MTALLAPPSLARWQTEIAARLVDGRPPGALEADTAAGRVGWATTVALFRQWRLYRLRTQAPLTVRVLADAVDATVESYFAIERSSTSYSARDADAFLAHVAAETAEPAIAAVARLERAFLAARRPASSEREPAAGPTRSLRSSVFVLPYDLRSLLAWACGAEVMPTPHASPVLVAPGVHGWSRPATDTELALWCALERRLDGSRLRGVGAVAMQSLIEAGAVVPSR